MRSVFPVLDASWRPTCLQRCAILVRFPVVAAISIQSAAIMVDRTMDLALDNAT